MREGEYRKELHPHLVSSTSAISDNTHTSMFSSRGGFMANTWNPFHAYIISWGRGGEGGSGGGGERKEGEEGSAGGGRNAKGDGYNGTCTYSKICSGLLKLARVQTSHNNYSLICKQAAVSLLSTINYVIYAPVIRESVDTLCRDGTDTPYSVIQTEASIHNNKPTPLIESIGIVMILVYWCISPNPPSELQVPYEDRSWVLNM